MIVLDNVPLCTAVHNYTQQCENVHSGAPPESVFGWALSTTSTAASLIGAGNSRKTVRRRAVGCAKDDAGALLFQLGTRGTHLTISNLSIKSLWFPLTGFHP